MDNNNGSRITDNDPWQRERNLSERPVEAPPFVPDERVSALRDLMSVVRARFWTILASVVVVFTLFAVRTFRATPIYQASALLLMESNMPQVALFPTSSSRDWWTREQETKTRVQLITSRAVLEKALQDKRVANYFRPEGTLAAASPTLWGGIADELNATFGKEPPRPQEPWERLRGVVEVEPIEETSLVKVKVSGPDPQQDAIVANAVAEAFVSHSVATRKSNALEAFRMLQDQKKEQEATLVKAEDALQAFRESADLTHLASPDVDNPVTSRLKLLNQEYTAVQLVRIQTTMAHEIMRKELEGKKDVTALLAVAAVRSDPQIQGLHSQIAQIDLDMKLARESYGPQHPKVTALGMQRQHYEAQVREAVLQVAQVALGQSAAQLAAIEHREKQLLAALNDQNQRALELSKKSHGYERLRRDVDRQTRLFGVIVDRLKEIDLGKDTGLTNVSLAERAEVPIMFVSPNRQRALVLGGILGLMLGIGLAYFLEHLDDTVKTPEEVETNLGMASLGYVPDIPAASGGVNGFPERATYSLTHRLSSAAEAFRAIRTNVYFSGERGQMKTIHVTSPSPGDGKSVLAANLAVILACDGKRVLLVDADLRRPTIHTAFGMDKEPGLTNILVEGKPLEELVRTPPEDENGRLDNLHILCAGSTSPNPAELLGGEAMAKFMRDTREKYDAVIYDSCPVLFVADNAPLCTRSDGTILVFRSGKTHRAVAGRARRQIEQVKGKFIGAVVNEVRPKTLKGYRYGYYYHDYSRYYSEYNGKKS